MSDALTVFARRAVELLDGPAETGLAARFARGQVLPVVSGIVRGKAALEGEPEEAARQFALAVLQAAVLAFPDCPRPLRMGCLIDHQRRRIVRRPPAARKIWRESSESFLYSSALRRAARLFTEVACPRTDVERLRDAAADLATLLALLLERRGALGVASSGDAGRAE